MRSINIRVLVLFALLVIPAISLSQTTDADAATQPQKSIIISADWNRFRAPDSLNYLEFSAAVGRTGLDYVQTEDGYSTEFMVEAQLVQADTIVARKVWRNKNTVDSLGAINEGQQLYVANDFYIEPGEYELSLKLYDVTDSTHAAVARMPLNTKSFNDSPAISDVQAASQIVPASTDDRFVKNGFQVLPNPAGIFGIGLPILYTYTELYNLVEGTSEEGEKYTVQYRIFDQDGNLAKEYPSKTRQKPGGSAVDVNNLNVVTLSSGAYTLHIQLVDHETDSTASTQRRFFVYREADYSEENLAKQQMRMQDNGIGSAGLDADRYDVMSEEALDEEFESARYIADKSDQRTWKDLDLEGKRNYIQEFWAEHDETPGTPRNEFKQAYLGRVQLANTLYRGTFRDGWKTDRGRILLVYGKPDEIERFPQSGENREYSVWHYYAIQGGVHFIFVDKRALGDQELVHSTARGELYDPDWTRWIDPNN